MIDCREVFVDAWELIREALHEFLFESSSALTWRNERARKA